MSMLCVILGQNIRQIKRIKTIVKNEKFKITNRDLDWNNIHIIM